MKACGSGTRKDENGDSEATRTPTLRVVPNVRQCRSADQQIGYWAKQELGSRDRCLGPLAVPMAAIGHVRGLP